VSRALSAAAVVLALAGPAGSAGADEVDGEGFGVPGGTPWSEARERLVVQIRPAKASGAPGAIFRQDLPHTRTALVLAPDDPHEPAQDVTLADALAWNRTGEALFEIALENLATRWPASVRETPELRRGVKVSLFYGEHPYAAGYAIDVARRERCMGRRGALVAVPSQYALLCYPIDSSRAFHGYLALVNLSVEVVATGDAPIVPHVYWFRDGVWDVQRVTIEGDRFTHERTTAFEEMLKGLPRDIQDPRARRW